MDARVSHFASSFIIDLAFTMSRFRPFEAPTKVRFASYCLLSLASVAVSHFTHDNTNCAIQLLWLAGACFAAVGFAAYMDSTLHPSYTAPICAVLVLLSQLATWTQTYLTIPPTDTGSGSSTTTQAYVIHFAMSFYVLSESEHCRLYWITHRKGQPLTFRSLFDAYFAADHDPAFEQSKDCISYIYHFEVPGIELPLSRETLKWLIVDLFLFHFPFIFIWSCLSYPVKRLANPDLDDENLALVDSFMAGVLFTPKDTFASVPKTFLVTVGLYLQRPIRLFNRLLFWSIVDFTEYVWQWWNPRETTTLPT